MKNENKVYAIPAKFPDNLDGPEDAWLLVEDNHSFNATLKKAHSAAEVLRQHEIDFASFFAKGLYPVTGYAWEDNAFEVLIERLANAGYWNNDDVPNTATAVFIELPPLDVINDYVKADTPGLVKTIGHDYWIEVVPKNSFHADIALYTHPKYGGGRIHGIVPRELVKLATEDGKKAPSSPT